MDFSTSQVQPSPYNVVAIAGFVLSISAFIFGWFPIFGWLLWIIGLGLSIAGVFKTPRGFAIAGIVISVITIVLYATLTLAILDYFDGDFERVLRELDAFEVLD